MGLNYNDKKLLDKYNLSLSCLEYSYIKCTTNVKEIENILRVLRSGEEGIYPDLITFCENRLRELSPKSKLLQEAKKVTSYSELPHAEQASLHSDLKTWIEDIKIQENDLKNSKKIFGSSYPIRNMGESKNRTEEKREQKLKEDSFKSKSKSYEEWNKFDVDKEIERLEQEQKIVTEAKQNNICHIGKEPPLPFVDVTGLTEAEKQSLAEKEKVKGNECFKTKDYVNSAVYYSRSISAYPTAIAMCNRAFSHMKLKNFEAAVFDCDAALNLDPCYVKAFYRRGLSYKEMGRMQLAYMDFERALTLDSTCKEAEMQLKEISKCPVITSSSPTTKSPVIEEIFDANTKVVKKNNSDLDSLKHKLSSKHYSEKKNENNDSKKSETTDNSSPEVVILSSNEQNQQISFDVENEDKIKCANVNSGSSKSHANLNSPYINKLKAESAKKINSYINQDNTKINELINKPKTDKKFNLCSNESGDMLQSAEKSIGVERENSKSNCKEMFDLQNEKMTPFKFLKFWHNLNAYKNSEIGASILSKISPNELSSYVTNKLDADLLYSLILAIKEFTISGDWFKSYEYLRNLISIPRIKTVSVLLSSSQQKEIENLLAGIEESQRKEINELKLVVLGKV